MTVIQAILMGIIQGLTEFLPVSSSGHITLTSAFYKFFTNNDFLQNSGEEIFFDMVLHIGTLIAVLIYFRKEIWEILSAFFKAIKLRDFSDENAKLAVSIIVGTFFTILIAYPLKDITEKLVFNPACVGGILIITAIVLLAGEFFGSKIKEKNDKITLKTAIIMGIAQGLAAFPGLSRSGTTISAGLICGLERVKCAKYSFLLSFPIILGASVFYPLLEIETQEFVTYNWLAIFIGFIFAGVFGYLCIKYFLAFLNKYSMKCFAYYCIIIGVFSIIFFNIFK